MVFPIIGCSTHPICMLYIFLSLMVNYSIVLNGQYAQWLFSPCVDLISLVLLIYYILKYHPLVIFCTAKYRTRSIFRGDSSKLLPHLLEPAIQYQPSIVPIAAQNWILWRLYERD